jgi:hypothetical protein
VYTAKDVTFSCDDGYTLSPNTVATFSCLTANSASSWLPRNTPFPTCKGKAEGEGGAFWGERVCEIFVWEKQWPRGSAFPIDRFCCPWLPLLLTSVAFVFSSVSCRWLAAVSCGTVNPLVNGVVTYTNNGNYPSSAVYSCQTGFVLSFSENAVRTCVVKGTTTRWCFQGQDYDTCDTNPISPPSCERET